MCPACLTAAVWTVAGTTSAAGLVAVVATRMRRVLLARSTRLRVPLLRHLTAYVYHRPSWSTRRLS